MPFYFIEDTDYEPLSNICTLFKVINNAKKTPDYVRSKIYNKVIEAVNTQINKSIRHDITNNTDGQINKLIEDEQLNANNEILNNVKYCNVLIYDINKERNSGFTLTSLIEKRKMGTVNY